MTGFDVNLAAFGGAKNTADTAADHYNALYGALKENVRSLRDKKEHPLSGGHGITGHVQGLLNEFGEAWLREMDKFVADEYTFVEFLRGFSTRLKGTHDLYRQLDDDHAQTFNQIGRSLGSERP